MSAAQGTQPSKTALNKFAKPASARSLAEDVLARARAGRAIVLVNDYGQAEVKEEDDFEHQRFSLATFAGINFPLLRAYFGEAGRCEWAEPAEEAGGIHSRLLARRPAAAVLARFHACFAKAAHERLQEPVGKARACVRVGRFEMAATYYHQALERQPANWVLLNEAALFLTFTLRDVKAGIDLARVALAQNPACSAEL